LCQAHWQKGIREISHALYDDFGWLRSELNIASLESMYNELDLVFADISGVDDNEHLQHPRWPLVQRFAAQSLPALLALLEEAQRVDAAKLNGSKPLEPR
jgi:hypothetical protein